MNLYTLLTILTGGLSLLCLIALHFTSPEFKPAWRMISEYATGKYKWLLSLFFYLWGVSSVLLAFRLSGLVTGFWAYTGLVMLTLSGIGAISGGLFDVKHKNHGLAFALGVPTMPIAALLISYHLFNTHIITEKKAILSAHATWISILIMAFTMMLMFSGFKKAGITWDKDSAPPTEIPGGVIALGGYANRFLVLCYQFWVIYMAYLIG